MNLYKNHRVIGFHTLWTITRCAAAFYQVQFSVSDVARFGVVLSRCFKCYLCCVWSI